MATVPTLETERLILRNFEARDFDAMLDLYGTEDTARFIGGVDEPHMIWRRLATYVGHWHLRGFGFFAIEEKASGEMAGFCGPWYPHGWPEQEIGYGLRKKFHQRGLGFEAAKRCLSFAYDELGWTTAISSIDPQNEPSKRLAMKLGAKFEEIKQVYDFSVDIYRHLSPEDFRKHHSL